MKKNSFWGNRTKSIIKGILPPKIIIGVRRINTLLCDIFTGKNRKFCRHFSHDFEIDPYHFSIHQPIIKNEWLEAKLNNLDLALANLQGIRLEPGNIFSFWHHIGNPKPSRGYHKSRILQRGLPITGTGGGLCQLASGIFELALRLNLTILERHPHSTDIYDEGDRFTPLGLDAAVVYGYKDLRIYNPTQQTFVFYFQVSPTQLQFKAFSDIPIKPFQLQINRSDFDERRSARIEVIDAHNNPTQIITSQYQTLRSLQK